VFAHTRPQTQNTVNSRSQHIFSVVPDLSFQNFISVSLKFYKVLRTGVERPFYGTISISAAVPWAESGLIQTLSLAGSAAN
jgi:hypothetical protein